MNKIVLIIEDNSAVTETMKTLLEIEGYTVYTAAEGNEAIQVLKTHKLPGVILLDMMMPGMNGWGFLDFQRNQAEYVDIPVVIVSAFGEIAQSVHPDAFIPKPVKFDLLLQTVEKYTA